MPRKTLLAALTLAVTAGAVPIHAAITPTGDVSPVDPTTWIPNTTGYIGNTADGSLTVDAGSTLLSQNGYLGYATGTTGTVTVNGPGSIWSAPNTLAAGGLAVGYSGAGTLNITNGGAVNASINIGANTGSAGAVTVDGTGSSLSNNGITTAGNIGRGTLTVTHGGKVTSSIIYIANGNPSIESSITVDGPGSTLTSTKFLAIGALGSGALNITGGGTVNSVESDIGANTSLDFHYNGSKGIVTIDGTGSTWTNSSLVIGGAGTGTVNLVTGALSSATEYVGEASGSAGTVNQSGGTHTVSDWLAIAGNGSTGNYNLIGGSLTASSTLSLGPGGTLTQTGGTCSMSSLTLGGGSIVLGGSQQIYALNILHIGSGKITLTADAAKSLSTKNYYFGGTTNAWTGQLELGANAFIVEATTANKPSTLSTLQNQVAYGATHAAAITSATTTADPTHKITLVIDNALLNLTQLAGQPVDANSLLIESTWLGDSNLDRKVDVTDLGVLATHYGQSTPNGPAFGDFNNDGKVDVTDLGLLATNYGAGTTGAPFSSIGAGQPPTGNPAPEPTTLALLAFSIPSLLRRNRHKMQFDKHL